MRKGYTGKQTVTVLSNLGTSGSAYNLSLSNTGFRAGSVVTDIISCTNITVNSSGRIAVPMASGEPRILYPSSVLKGSSLCA